MAVKEAVEKRPSPVWDSKRGPEAQPQIFAVADIDVVERGGRIDLVTEGNGNPGVPQRNRESYSVGYNVHWQ